MVTARTRVTDLCQRAIGAGPWFHGPEHTGAARKSNTPLSDKNAGVAFLRQGIDAVTASTLNSVVPARVLTGPQSHSAAIWCKRSD